MSRYNKSSLNKYSINKKGSKKFAKSINGGNPTTCNVIKLKKTCIDKGCNWINRGNGYCKSKPNKNIKTSSANKASKVSYSQPKTDASKIAEISPSLVNTNIVQNPSEPLLEKKQDLSINSQTSKININEDTLSHQKKSFISKTLYNLSKNGNDFISYKWLADYGAADRKMVNVFKENSILYDKIVELFGSSILQTDEQTNMKSRYMHGEHYYKIITIKQNMLESFNKRLSELHIIPLSN